MLPTLPAQLLLGVGNDKHLGVGDIRFQVTLYGISDFLNFGQRSLGVEAQEDFDKHILAGIAGTHAVQGSIFVKKTGLTAC